MADIDGQLRMELDRAAKARQIMEDSTVKASFDQLEKELFEAMLATSADDASRREKIHMMLVFGRKWKNLFETMIETGKLAQLQLEQKRKLNLWSRHG